MILHCTVKTAVKLHDLNVIGSLARTFCGAAETLEQLFYFCPRSRKVWFWACNILNRYWKKVFDIQQVVFLLPFPPCKHNNSCWFVKIVNYYIWIHRNSLVFENNHTNAIEIITRIRSETYARVEADKYRFGKYTTAIWGSLLLYFIISRVLFSTGPQGYGNRSQWG